MARERYQWTPLGPGQFRVLEILQLEPTISIILRTGTFEATIEYYAFSYSWGRQEQSEAIECDSKMLLITPHLKEGLKQVSQASGKRVFWVDAICISQQDPVEKGEQVANIWNIFGNANAVFAWLGAATEKTDAVFAVFNKLKDQEPALPAKPTLDDIATVILSPRTSDRYKVFPPDLFKSVVDIAQREWFERLWIAQEYIYARSVVFFCGKYSLDGRSFVGALRKFNIWSFGGVRPEISGTAEDLRGFRLIREIDHVRMAQTQGQHMSYFNIVMSNRERKTYEPVDRIYGCIGLAIGHDSVYTDGLTIDYSEENKSRYWNLYTQFGKIALIHEPHLRLLEFASSLERPSLLPSWCPNLNSPCSTNRFEDGIYSAGGPCRITSISERTCAEVHPGLDDIEHGCVQSSSLSDRISIIGAQLDVVQRVGSVCDWTDYNEDSLIESQQFALDALMWFKESEELCMGIIKPPSLAKQVLYRALNASTVSMDHCKTEQRKILKDTDAVVYEEAKSLLVSILQLEEGACSRTHVPKLYDSFDALSHWFNNVASIYEGRVLFTTKSGRIGIASKDISEGDIVCMLYSGRLLYVLRHIGGIPDIYRFISDAYLFDFMNGKAFELLHEGRIHEKEFSVG